MLEKNITDAIDPSDPWARDKLDRKKVADYLTPVIDSIRQPFVVSLHSEYGTGKSFFLECWKQDLQNQGFKTVLFNAWETDFSQDALSAFIASMKRQLSDDDESIKKSFTELAKNAGGFARSKLLPTLAKAAAKKLVGSEGMNEINEGLEELGVAESDLISLLSSTAVQALAAQEAAEQSMKSFKGFLKDMIEGIVEVRPKKLEEGIDEHQGKQKLIVFVDELDRCRPTYAVEVLECIKHLFNVEGLVFVLAIDDLQMHNAISSVYGASLDGDGYLRKFIDWQYMLPPVETQPFIKFLATFYGLASMPNYSEPNSYYKSIDSLAQGFLIIDGAYGLSLRKLKQYMSIVNLITRAQSSEHVPFSLTLGVFVGLFFQDGLSLKKAVVDFKEAELLYGEINKLLMVREPNILFWDDRFEAIFLSWFVNDLAATQLSQRMSSLEYEIDELVEQNTSDTTGQRHAKETEYKRLHEVIKMSKGKNSYGFYDSSIAEIVYERIKSAQGFI